MCLLWEEQGQFLHYDGNVWTVMDSNTKNALNGVWGTSSQDVFVVGDDGTILRYDGNTWTPMDSGTENNLMGVWGVPAATSSPGATGARFYNMMGVHGQL